MRAMIDRLWNSLRLVEKAKVVTIDQLLSEVISLACVNKTYRFSVSIYYMYTSYYTMYNVQCILLCIR